MHNVTPIDLLAQSAALFCPYCLHKSEGAKRLRLSDGGTFSTALSYLHNVTPIDFDVRTVFNEHNIYILHKVTPLDLLAQVAGTLGSIGGSI